MEHPFVNDLSSKSLEELTEAVNKLNKNLAYAARNGKYSIADQIRMVLETYRAEVNKQQRALLEDGNSITGSIDIS